MILVDHSGSYLMVGHNDLGVAHTFPMHNDRLVVVVVVVVDNDLERERRI